MQLTAYEIALIGGGFTVIGVLLGGWITYRFALYLTIQSTRREAGAKLRSAFAPALAFIYITKNHGSTHDVPDSDEFLKRTSPILAAAVEVFRPFVPENERGAYQEAWDKYHHESVIYGFNSHVCVEDMESAAKLFENFIHDILRFADSK